MTLLYDNATAGTFAAATSKTVTHTMGTAPYGAVFAFFIWDGATPPTSASATWNTVTMADLSMTNPGATRGVQGWVITAPATGSHNCAVSWTNSTRGVISVISFTGADQIIPYANIAKGNGNSTTPTVNVLNTLIGQLVLDAVFIDHSAGDTLTVGASQIERNNTVNSDMIGATSTAPGGGTVTMTWTDNNARQWRKLGMSVMPAVLGNNILIF